MRTLNPTLVKAALAVGGMVLVAVVVVLAVLASRDSGGEPELLADSMAGQATEVLQDGSASTVWVSGSGSQDPRPGGAPDPGLCTVTGQGSPALVEPDTTDTTTLGESTLYPVAGVEDYIAPLKVVCSGGDIDHVYVTR